MTYRVLACGGRDFRNVALAHKVLNELHATHGVTCLIEGGAQGADKLALLWAISRKPSIDIESYQARWDTLGRGAGFIRNARMLKEGKPDLVVAFPGGEGTRNMVTLARRAGVPIILVAPYGDLEYINFSDTEG